MDVTLWTAAILLAVVFALAGALKAATPKAKLRERMGWVDGVPNGAVKMIGAVELAGAAGLILPAATGIALVLTPLAAAGLALTMVPAAVLHIRRDEFGRLPLNVVLFALAVFVAWGRFGPYAF